MHELFKIVAFCSKIRVPFVKVPPPAQTGGYVEKIVQLFSQLQVAGAG